MGRTTGQGIAGNISRLYPAWSFTALVTLLLVANIINIGADLGAMGEASGSDRRPASRLCVAFGFLCVALQIFLRYTRYVSVLKWLTVVLFAYVAMLFVVQDRLGARLR